jgi:hypothetical protein
VEDLVERSIEICGTWSKRRKSAVVSEKLALSQAIRVQ